MAAGKRNAGGIGSWQWETIRNWEGYEGTDGLNMGGTTKLLTRLGSTQGASAAVLRATL